MTSRDTSADTTLDSANMDYLYRAMVEDGIVEPTPQSRLEIDALNRKLRTSMLLSDLQDNQITGLKEERDALKAEIARLKQQYSESMIELGMESGKLKAENERLRDALSVADATLRASGQYLMANALCAATMTAAPDTKGE